MMEKKKKKWGDRPDGVRVRNLDSMHVFMPYMLPNRTDNEAFISEKVDLSAINAFLEKKNAESPQYKYTIFHVVTAALAKTIYHRPKLNRFIAGRRLYERNEILLAFTAKRVFSDDGDEALLLINCDENTTVDSLHDTICHRVSKNRKEGEVDGATKIMNILAKMPRIILRGIVGIMNFMEYHGCLPAFLRYVDPYHSTVFISNLGSIKLNAAYHHLANWGTNSLFVVIGEKHLEAVANPDGTIETKEVLPLGITLDERIADGYYYTKSIKLLKHLLTHPELLDLPAGMAVDYEEKKVPAGK
ncbi:MAG: 2-oxo acid dehydrogenase subunit E2 [Clostridia bacterium]|nr:2-oxo acid dehydrogenase subunit E2 [Clostridia bacterium]